MTLAAVETPVVAAVSSASDLLAATYRQLGACCAALNVRVAVPGSPLAEGQAHGAELADHPALLAAFIDAEAHRIQDHYQHIPRHDVAASRALHDYIWPVALLMSGAWYLERRVPRIQPQDVRIDLATGGLEIVPRGGFACLPDDPAARLPGARTLAHEEALRAELRSAVADHVRPLIAAMGSQLRRGPRALWGMVGDDLTSGIWYLGRMLDQEGQAIREADRLLPGAIPPFPAGAGFRHLSGSDGQAYPTRTRASCCLYYTVRRDAEACITCPRTCDAERLRRLTSRMSNP